jgi:hypothetical protein
MAGAAQGARVRSFEAIPNRKPTTFNGFRAYSLLFAEVEIAPPRVVSCVFE